MDDLMKDISSIRSGDFVSDYIEPIDDSEELDSESIQPNGVDLSINQIWKLTGKSKISNGDYDKPERITVQPNEDDFYELDSENSYVVQYDEIIEIPENHIGLVFPRSRMMRCGMTIETAVWDSGYKGNGEGGLVVHQDGVLYKSLRVAQIIFLPTEELDSHYDGKHQGQRL